MYIRLPTHHHHHHHTRTLSSHAPRVVCCVQVFRMACRRALKAVLIDLSGTLHIEDAAVPGAQDALNR